MGLLGELAEKLAARELGVGNAAAAPQQTAITGALELLNHPSIGGVEGLAQLFQNNGLGHLVAGWTSGQTPAVSPGALQQVLGDQRIAEFAQKLGIPTDQAASHLAELLPHVVGHLGSTGATTPGSIDVESVASELKSKLFG